MEVLKSFFASFDIDEDFSIDHAIEKRVKNMKERHKQKVWILIDNFDYPMMRGFKHNFLDSTDLKEFY
jgi:hypothetical protein